MRILPQSSDLVAFLRQHDENPNRLNILGLIQGMHPQLAAINQESARLDKLKLLWTTLHANEARLTVGPPADIRHVRIAIIQYMYKSANANYPRPLDNHIYGIHLLDGRRSDLDQWLTGNWWI